MKRCGPTLQRLKAFKNHYGHQVPRFGTEVGTEAEFYFPIRDLWNFAQTWSRYQAVRDGMACFAGITEGRDYLRSQFSPDRDRSRLRSGAQFIAAEGAVASFFFWLSTSRAIELNASPGKGFDQEGILEAEKELLSALERACKLRGLDATVIDVVKAHYDLFPKEREHLLKNFIDISRGVTADRTIAKTWRELYDCSIELDGKKLRTKVLELEKKRKSIFDEAMNSPQVLDRTIGKVLPIQATEGLS